MAYSKRAKKVTDARDLISNALDKVDNEDGIVSIHLPALRRLFDHTQDDAEAALRKEVDEERVREVKAKVQRATASIWLIAPDVAYDILASGKGLLQLAPIPGLDAVGSILLNIWDAARLIKANRKACLRLTERCATMIITVHARVRDAGGEVQAVLEGPLQGLHSAFNNVLDFLLRMKDMNVLRSLIQRNEDRDDIARCNSDLVYAMNLFQVEVSIVHIGETRRQDTRDRDDDREDLRECLHEALQRGDDSAVLEILGVDHAEKAEMIVKVLGRLLWPEAAGPAVTIRSGSRRYPGVTSFVDDYDDHPLPDLDDLEREFLTASVEALTRLSQRSQTEPLTMAISHDEVKKSAQIGRGAFSIVYKGAYRGRVVAIKELNANISRELFVKELMICMNVQHPHVIPFIGTSSSNCPRPWFIITPYYRNGNLVRYLKGIPAGVPIDVTQMMLDIAQAMQYLHGRGIKHGDLKALNVLVNNDSRCIVADFGQSQARFETSLATITDRGLSISRAGGTLMWLAPEALSGLITDLTKPVDIYAFAIVCVEILKRGDPPWGSLAGNTELLTNLVCVQKKRPPLPAPYDNPSNDSPIAGIIKAAWDGIPEKRPSFRKIVNVLANSYGRESHFRATDTSPMPSVTQHQAPAAHFWRAVPARARRREASALQNQEKQLLQSPTSTSTDKHASPASRPGPGILGNGANDALSSSGSLAVPGSPLAVHGSVHVASSSSRKTRKVMQWFLSRPKGAGKLANDDLSANTAALRGASYASVTPRSEQDTYLGTSALDAGTAPEAPKMDNGMKLHHGAVDQTAITSEAPPLVIARVRAALASLGIDNQDIREYRIECTRLKRKPIAVRSAAGQGADRKTELPVPEQGSGQVVNGSVDSSANGTSLVDSSTAYGDPSTDVGDEVRFEIELTRIARLAGTYSLDFRRVRGNLSSYRFLCTTIKDRVALQR
ncbi:unnamed protein product [Peniophora sp. CBMAI 1063]|nr:unnamed protein product [Peniophora sp. CBMAI 1063]